MAQLSASQIANYAYGAGFRGNALVMAVAISFAESGGNTTAIGHNSDGSTDYGLWQINSSHSQYNPTLLINNPAYNAQAAYTLSSQGSSWRPWCTAYSDGLCGTRGGTYLGSGAPYQKFLAQAQAAALGSTTPQPTPGSPSALTVDQVFTAKGLWKWYSSHVTNPFNGTTERGADYAASWGTPVGCIIGGKVIRIVHNNNSIGDVVEIQTGNGDITLYQHIRTRVAPGQLVSTGDVVGTEDGLPVDQYSTGPHIECRYCPASRYIFSNGSWNQGWIDPVPIFSRIGLSPATGPNVSLGTIAGGITAVGGFGVSTSPPKTYTPLLDQVHQTLVDTPGFYGIALALDEAEQFPGWIDLTQPASVDIPISAFGMSTGDIQLPVPDIPGTARSIGATITDNFVPLVIRGGLVVLGSVLFMMLLGKALLEPVEKIVPLALEAAA